MKRIILIIKIMLIFISIILRGVGIESSPAPIPLMTSFDTTWDALKCAMKISLIQMSKYHNNRISCCGLWVIKYFMKSSAEEYCERAEGAKAVFDQYINEELIYNQMVRSVLGDETLSCRPYPEDSPECSRLWIMIILMLILLNIFVMTIFIWCCCVTIFWCRTRQKYHRLKAKIDDRSSESKISHTNQIYPAREQVLNFANSSDDLEKLDSIKTNLQT
ncbi:hypothetical protein SSS_01354 [Sarcoptes scabiei]|uniref:Uncharacterized protein n=1 Tax=Sarcoptes scabiei TaxID=52283 RepID=A0A834R6U5_SARSC|nr:hypothetical protein SSS_01354 [Sarcoptes scabiei]